MAKLNYMTYSMIRYCKNRLTSFSIVKKLLSSQSETESSIKFRARKVLGIETSCDDTGAAIVDENGEILGHSLHSQTRVTVDLGGVLPSYAKALHRQHIDSVVQESLNQANLHPKDLDAVAVTVKPGLALCLEVGLTYAKKLVLEHRIPMIPIHHMEAHALTARMIEKIDFPFLVLLVSGGHCLLAVAKDIDEFLLLGRSTDSPPGEAFDKVARRMKLKNLPACFNLSGGAMIEKMAEDGDVLAIPAPNVAVHGSCNFSFAGIKSHYLRAIEEEEEKQGVIASQVIANASDMCASFQYAVLKHIAKSLQKAFMFCEMKELLPPTKTLVVSGGVACNKYLNNGLKKVCKEFDCKLVCPPNHLCTDNGIMIAWNGIEKMVAGRDFAPNPQLVDFTARAPFGTDITTEVSRSTIKLHKLDLLS